MKKITILFSLVLIMSLESFAQCANTANIFSFTYNGHDYEIVKENKTWEDAASCAVERGGYLCRIDDSNEQLFVFDRALNKAGVILANTVATDGGNASYVWLGGNDIASEGVWIWDGDNDGNGDQFWQGNANGSPVDGLYTNWGTEPDNWTNQDALGLALTEWPLGSGTLGQPGQWNDVKDFDTLYYVIEYNGTSSVVSDEKFSDNLVIYPNPVANFLYLNNNTDEIIQSISIFNQIGKLIVTKDYSINSFEKLDISKIQDGIYLVEFESLSGNIARKSIVIIH